MKKGQFSHLIDFLFRFLTLVESAFTFVPAILLSEIKYSLPDEDV